jgi:Ca2+-binding EF-hand superfamily protein
VFVCCVFPPAMKKAVTSSAASSNDLKLCREAFNLFDADQSGFIDAKELQQLAYSLGKYFHSSTWISKS